MMDLFQGPFTVYFKAEEGEPEEHFGEDCWAGTDGGFLHVYSKEDPSFDDLIIFFNLECVRSIDRRD